MILTVTLNAALDVTYQVAELRPGGSHRVQRVRQRAGGKGVNVARVLRSLGVDAVLTGLVGGATGAPIRADLARSGLADELVDIAGESRRTVSVVAGGEATLFNESGPEVTEQEWAAFRLRFVELAVGAAAVVLAGSLPRGLAAGAYGELIGASPAALTVLDTSGAALTAALPAGPAVVKPNADELRAATGCADLQAGAAALHAAGARAVVVSAGPDGLLAALPDRFWQDGTVSAPDLPKPRMWRARPPQTLAGNPTGAGDALVAALTAALVTGASWPDALAEAVAVSAAAVAAPVAGDIDQPTYRRLRPQVTVEELDADPGR